MSTVFTGESKIFQLAGIDFEAKSNQVPQISRNVPVISAMMDGGFSLVEHIHKGRDVSDSKFKATFLALYETVDNLTNIFLEEMERDGLTWAEIHAKWLSYNAALQNSCAQDMQVRLSKLGKG